MTTFTFKKNAGSQSYRVYTARQTLHPIGLVRKVERWTVRGTRIEWESYRKGKYVGNSSTRKEAAEYLEKTQ